LIDGTEFDSSYQRKAPATFKVNGVIKGWTEALQLMKEGAKWQLFVPSEIAYGERGAGPNIGPNAVLIFEIELVSAKEESSAPSKPGSKQGPAAPRPGAPAPKPAPAK
jgi:FKBP-type peptidyl-prolyl cis-trans isomerase FklB